MCPPTHPTLCSTSNQTVATDSVSLEHVLWVAPCRLPLRDTRCLSFMLTEPPLNLGRQTLWCCCQVKNWIFLQCKKSNSRFSNPHSWRNTPFSAKILPHHETCPIIMGSSELDIKHAFSRHWTINMSSAHTSFCQRYTDLIYFPFGKNF